MADSPLAGRRVLDLSTELAFRCTKILAGLGADVLRIEPPNGHPARMIGPFYRDTPHPERSLYWWFFNQGKRGITLNLESPDGRALFRRLVEGADFLVESFKPGYLGRQGLGWTTLRGWNPRLIMTSVSPFGESGPYASHEATDATILAMGGLMYLTGIKDGLPARIFGSPAYNSASYHAAAGTMIAHFYRERTGEGQRVEVSAQEAVSLGLTGAPQAWYLMGEVRSRGLKGNRRSSGGRTWRTVFPCKDGWVIGMLLTGRAFPQLVEWMDSFGMAGDLKDHKWRDRGAAEGPRALSQEELYHIEELIAQFTQRFTKAELYTEAQRHDVAFMPANSMKDVLENEQLAFRDYWVAVDHPEVGTQVTYPGAPFKLTETPWALGRRAPLIGEHNEEVYIGELGLTSQELCTLREAGAV